jgi:hypothetical protein
VCLRVAHNAPDYWSGLVTEPHIVVVLVPKIRTTAFACRYFVQETIEMDKKRLYLRDYAKREGWFVTIAVILLIIPIFLMGFVGLVLVMWAYGIPWCVAVR